MTVALVKLLERCALRNRVRACRADRSQQLQFALHRSSVWSPALADLLISPCHSACAERAMRGQDAEVLQAK